MGWQALFATGGAIGLIPIDLSGNAIRARYLYFPARRPRASSPGTTMFAAAIYRARVFNPPPAERGIVIRNDMELVLLPQTIVRGSVTNMNEAAAGGAFSRDLIMTPTDRWYVGFAANTPFDAQWWCPQEAVATGASGWFNDRGALSFVATSYDAFPAIASPNRIVLSSLPLFTLLSHRGLYQFGTSV